MQNSTIKACSKNISRITLPCHWDKPTIELIVKNNKAPGPVVSEVYGALAEGGPVGHGRTSTSVAPVTKKMAINYRKFLKSLDVNLTYLLNAPFKFIDKQHEYSVNEYLDWIMNELRPDALTITSLELMRFVRKKSPNIDIHISTIAGVKTGEDLKPFIEVEPNRVVPHHDCGKNWNNLKSIIRVAEKNEIDVEVLSTESCLYHCSNRTAHYNCLAKHNPDKKFHTTCNSRKLLSPEEFLLAGGIIRPEDIQRLINMGVGYFKLSGRAKPAYWLPDVALAYQQRSYQGNLVRLLGIDPNLQPEEWIYINNKALDGFLDSFPQTGNYDEEKSYARRWIVELYKSGDFKLLDGTKYRVCDDRLIIDQYGERCRAILERETNILK